MRLFNLFKKKEEFVFTFDEGNDVYCVEINGITFHCETLLDHYDVFAKDLANAYEQKLPEIIDFLLEDIETMFDVNDVEAIKNSLGKPLIDLDRCVLSYLEHTFDGIHIIDVEFDGVFDRLLYSSIDG